MQLCVFLQLKVYIGIIVVLQKQRGRGSIAYIKYMYFNAIHFKSGYYTHYALVKQKM
jgi:hypothetical protein